MLELISIHERLGPREPLATYGTKDGWEVWTRQQVMRALRVLVPGEYALHSGSIGEATRLVALSLQAWAIQREGRWKRDAFMMYVRANREDEKRASKAKHWHIILRLQVFSQVKEQCGEDEEYKTNTEEDRH